MSRRTLKLSPILLRSLLVGTLLISTAALSSCNTTAVISIGETQFAQVKTSGMTLTGHDLNSCKAASAQNNRLASRFVLLGTSDAGSGGTGVVGLRKGDEVRGTPVDLKEDNIQFGSQSSVALYNSENCTSTSCTAPLQCISSDFTVGANKNWCQELKTFSAGTPTFLSRNEAKEKQLFAVLFENTASMRGIIPGAGKQISPDPGAGAPSLIRNLSRQLEEVAKYDKERDEIETDLALYQFNSAFNDPVLFYPKKQTSFNNASSSSGAVSEFAQTLTDVRGNAAYSQGKSNLYQALEVLVNSDSVDGSPTLKKAAETYKEIILFIFVDGPDQISTGQPDMFNGVAGKLKEKNIRTFIVHVDPAVQVNGGALPSVVGKSCNNNDECSTYQRCEDVSGVRKCVLHRDANGRTGPIDQFSQLACLTGGGYIYIPNTMQAVIQTGSSPLDPSWTPWALNSLWEVPVGIGGGVANIVKRGQYEIGTDLRVKVGDTERSISLIGTERAALVSE